MECTGDNKFLTHVINKLMRGGAFLDLTFTSKKELGRHVKVEQSWCSFHKEEFRILQGRNKTSSRVKTLDLTEQASVIGGLEGARKEDPGSYRLVNFTSVCGNVIKQTILESISKHLMGKEVIWSSLYEFKVVKSSLP